VARAGPALAGSEHGAETLRAFYLEDLYLARAVVAGNPRALLEFERSFSPVIMRAAASVRGSEHFTDENGDRSRPPMSHHRRSFG
jgi:hypothetical protein